MKIKEIESPLPYAKCYKTSTGCSILADVDNPHGEHISIANESRYPTWNEIKEARYALMSPSITVAMLLPPKEEYVNIHNNCFHLWEIKSEELRGLTA